MNRILTILVFLIIFLASGGLALASGFYVQSIGSLQVGGTAYDHYWYTNPNPTITGVAPAGASVTVTIDGTSGTATADASGNWSFPTTMAAGDHTVSMTTASIGGPYGFTLTIGAAPDGVTGIDPNDTPVAGSILPTIFLLILGLALLSPLALQKLLHA